MKERIETLEAAQIPETPADEHSPDKPPLPAALPSPVVAKEARMRWQGRIWLLVRGMQDHIEFLRTAWVVAVWNIIKEISNRMPSLLSMGKDCQQ